MVKIVQYWIIIKNRRKETTLYSAQLMILKIYSQIQGRKDKYNESHLAMNYFTNLLKIYARLARH